MIKFNVNSPQHLSLLFFGGFLLIDEIQQNGFYKNGNSRTKKVKILKNISGLGVKAKEDWETKKEGIYSVGEKVLNVLIKNKGISGEIAKLILEFRDLKKQLSTYYTSVENLIYSDGLIHSQFNTTATATGRLSCKNPNIQNVPQGDSKVTQHYISRFNGKPLFENDQFIPKGLLISADYSGIEPRIEAQMSGDIEAINDIINNIDPHTKNLALKLKQNYNLISEKVKTGELKEARRQIKVFTFSVQYGAGNKTVSENSGLSIEEVKDLKQKRCQTYPRLHQYYDWLRSEVQQKGFYTDPWGRIYKFKKYPPKFKWQSEASYSPNEIQNFRTQGFATATIVLSMIGKFWREKAIYNRNKYLMINTIHDSLMLDCKKEFEEDAKKDLTLLEDVAILSIEKFNYEFKVPIKIEVSTGESWYDL